MTNGWRRFSALMVLMVFALIQGWAPLLHAHVDAGDSPAFEAAARGIHLPDRAVPAPRANGPGDRIAVLAECQGDEGALVTAPIEHRRDGRLVTPPAPAVTPPAHVPPTAPSATSAILRCARPGPITAKADAAPPFPVGPPGLR